MPSNLPTPFLPTTRREFMHLSGRGLALLAFSRFAPAFLVNSARASSLTPEKDRSILVLVQLAGGNDGLNTLVPFEDANYYRLRPTIGIGKDRVLRLNHTLGLHPSCAALHGLFQEGRLGIVQNVGYPNPNRSHFRSSEIWETASHSSEFLATGWIGRYLDNACSGQPATHDPVGVHISNGVPQSFLSAHDHPTFGLLPGAGNHRENEENRRLLEALVGQPGAGENDNATFLKHTLMDSLVTEKKVQGVIGGISRPPVTPPTPSPLHCATSPHSSPPACRPGFTSCPSADSTPIATRSTSRPTCSPRYRRDSPPSKRTSSSTIWTDR